jgi:hypothetical protein
VFDDGAEASGPLAEHFCGLGESGFDTVQVDTASLRGIPFSRSGDSSFSPSD